MMEAFKAGEYDFRSEPSAARLATGYDFPAVTDGRVLVESFVHGRPSGMNAFVFNTRRGDLRGPHGSPGPGPRLRLRVDQQVAAARRLRADPEHLRQLRARLAGGAGGGRARPAGALPGPAPRRALRAAVCAARRRRQRPRQPPQGAAPPRRGGLGGSGRGASAGVGRAPDGVRDPARSPRQREDRARVRPQPRAPRRRGAGADRRHRAVSEPPQRLRLRHAHLPLGHVALAGKRAGVLLGVVRRRRGRHPQLPRGAGIRSSTPSSSA